MRTPKKHVAADGTVTYRVRHLKAGRNSSTTFRGPTAEQDARHFAEHLWVTRGGVEEDPRRWRRRGRPEPFSASPSSGTVVRLDDRRLDLRQAERIRQACVEEGLIDEDELLELGDLRFFAP